MFVLLLSNITISLVRNITPGEIRIPVYIIIVATFVTCVSLLMQAFMPALYDSLATFVNLIVVNCIILGRAEAFASKNDPVKSMFDALGMAIGFTIAISCVSLIREFLGAGTITIWGDLSIDCTGVFDLLCIQPIPVLVSNVGGFLILGSLISLTL